MSGIAFDVTFVWAGVIAFAVIMYVLLDGFDLGMGILFPAMRSERERDTAMNSVAPIWDFNETWLVLGGAGLFGAFPLAYATLLPAFYQPLLVMLIALVFRGVAFEFRAQELGVSGGERAEGLDGGQIAVLRAHASASAPSA